AQVPAGDIPRRAERARLAHQPERQRGRDDIADHRDQSDNAVDAVADIGARQDERDVEQPRQRIEPRQPLLAAEIAERISAAKIETKILKALPQRFRWNLAALLVDDRAARLRAAKRRAGVAGTRGPARFYVAVMHAHQMGNARAIRKLRHAVPSLSGPGERLRAAGRKGPAFFHLHVM